jgi:sensor domain CHASE-containing protein
MLSAPFYFSLGLGISLFFVMLFVLLVYLSVRLRKQRPIQSQSQTKAKLVSIQPKLNAKISYKRPMVVTNSHIGSYSARSLSPSFNVETYNRVRKLLEEKEDIKTIAQKEHLSLGEVRLIASLKE